MNPKVAPDSTKGGPIFLAIAESHTRSAPRQTHNNWNIRDNAEADSMVAATHPSTAAPLQPTLTQTTMTLLITDKECENLLTMKDSIAVIEEMFRMAGERDAENPARYRMSAPRGKGLQFGPAALHSKGLMGYKIRS